MFSKEMEKFSIRLMVGLCKDSEITLDSLELFEYRKGKCYFPDNGYFNSDLLPIEWLEFYESKEILL